MHARLGGYHLRDIEFTMGIDGNATEVEALRALGKSDKARRTLHKQLYTVNLQCKVVYQLTFEVT